jgi:hypothetical protein
LLSLKGSVAYASSHIYYQYQFHIENSLINPYCVKHSYDFIFNPKEYIVIQSSQNKEITSKITVQDLIIIITKVNNLEHNLAVVMLYIYQNKTADNIIFNSIDIKTYKKYKKLDLVVKCIKQCLS